MKTKTHLTNIILLLMIGLSLLQTGEDSHAATTQPTSTYRLVRQKVAGSQSGEWVFVIISPERSVMMSTYEKLQWSIEQMVPGGATLVWEPGGKMAEGQPLTSEEEVRALAWFCKDHAIKFFQIVGK